MQSFITLKQLVYNVTCRPIAKQRLRKQDRNEYAANNRRDPLLGNARSALTQQ
jgi:hypothetical protein